MRQAILIAVCVMSFYSCKKDPIPADNFAPGYNDLNGTWIMTSAKYNTTNTISTKPADEQGDDFMTLVVKDSNTVNLTDGGTWRNSVFDGVFSISNDRKIVWSHLSVTQVGETPWGRIFYYQAIQAYSYFFTDIDHLSFNTSPDITLNFQRKK
jgi:hypothetical protein